ncbi:MAG: helix-turn-helix domain-containing protein [Candidatus Sericytochromatia bacterium]|nr:helix-turn-helix domain-containing protein [Candidatus Sericytochromatia bacterium]
MTTVAEVLKRERETQGIPLEDVAQKTYIKLHYLHALEEDRPDLLPAPVYTCGYIRQYAKLLGLNGADLVNIYQQQHKPREYSIVRNSGALGPETRTEPRQGEQAYADAPLSLVTVDDEAEDLALAAEGLLEPMEAVSRPAPVAAVSRLDAGSRQDTVARPESTSRPAPLEVISRPVPMAEQAAPSASRPAAMGNPVPFSPSLSTAPPPSATVSRPGNGPMRQMPTPAAEPVLRQPKPIPNQLEVRIDTRDALLSHPEAEKVLVLARQQADEILIRAREEAQRLRQGAEQYAEQILMQLETDVSRTLAVIKNGRSHLQTRQRGRRTPERPNERERSAEAPSS